MGDCSVNYQTDDNGRRGSGRGPNSFIFCLAVSARSGPAGFSFLSTSSCAFLPSPVLCVHVSYGWRSMNNVNKPHQCSHSSCPLCGWRSMNNVNKPHQCSPSSCPLCGTHSGPRLGEATQPWLWCCPMCRPVVTHSFLLMLSHVSASCDTFSFDVVWCVGQLWHILLPSVLLFFLVSSLTRALGASSWWCVRCYNLLHVQRLYH